MAACMVRLFENIVTQKLLLLSYTQEAILGANARTTCSNLETSNPAAFL